MMPFWYKMIHFFIVT